MPKPSPTTPSLPTKPGLVSNRSPAALQRFFRELKAQAPKVDGDKMILSGIAVSKGGYHDSRENNQRNHPGNYSIELAVDKFFGPADCAAAIDITFSDAQKSDFRTIAKYFKRLRDAYIRRDPRLFYKGERVWRECFGNADLDREVEGWSLYQDKAKTSDESHQYHIHQSIHRKFADNWDAVKGALDIMLGKPLPNPIPGDDDMTAEQLAQILKAIADVKARQDAIYLSILKQFGNVERRDENRDLTTRAGLASALAALQADVDAIQTEMDEDDAEVPPQ